MLERFNYNLLKQVAKVKYEPKSKVAELDGNFDKNVLLDTEGEELTRQARC